MKKQAQRYVFSVCGTGEFPQDMLRYDNCQPLTDEDKRIVYAEYGKDDEVLWDNQTERLRANTVRLVTDRRFVTNARWRSFLWHVAQEPVLLIDRFRELPRVIVSD
jgi:hypothetical protein